MHLYCTGTGSPTVVLEAGLGDFSLSAWSSVQPQLSAMTRTCSYDRAGTGWSDPAPERATLDGITADLHALLQVAGVTTPVVLVGHSLGGPLVRRFAVRYPGEVAGLVLVDGSHENQVDRMTGMPGWVDVIYKVLPVVHFVGLDRIAMRAAPGDTMAALAGGLTTTDNSMAHTLAIATNLRAFLGAHGTDPQSLGNLPLTVLTAGKMAVPGVTPEVAGSIHREWVAMHKEVAALSTRGRWILADSSAHYIQRDQPGLVIEAVAQLIDFVRNAPPPGSGMSLR
jgi:pimeloyl-ACP methyl ester carboxylesterase